MENHKVTFESENQPADSGYTSVEIASGFISITEVTFKNEKIIAVVRDNGDVKFRDMEGNSLASVSTPGSIGGRGRYEEIYCRVEGDVILIKFPIYEWVDYYPNCDGEYDRWLARVVGFRPPIAFSLTTHTATILDD